MAKNPDFVKIEGSRTTQEGLLVKFSDGSFFLFDSSFLTENQQIQIVGSRTMEDGLFVKFSDGIWHPFDTSFLVKNRHRGDRIPNPSPWLDENWKRKPASSQTVIPLAGLGEIRGS
jgi:hypothetical protein